MIHNSDCAEIMSVTDIEENAFKAPSQLNDMEISELEIVPLPP